MWIRCVVTSLVLLGLTGQGWAQSAKFVTATFQSAAAATGNGTPLAVDLYTAVAVQVTISATATVTFEATSDGTTWVSRSCTSVADTVGSLVTTATASGVYQCNIAGMQQFRVRVSSFTSGTVTATGRATTALFSRGGGGGSGLVGATSFPGGPTTGQTVMITDDSAVGACDSAAGSAVSICYWTGAVWAAVGDGSGVGAGDISDVWACTTANCNALTAAAGDSLDAGSADTSRPTTRSTTLPGTCLEGQHHQDTDSGGSETYVCTDVNVWQKLVIATDNVSTASALAANGANCSAGSAPLGVDASGAAETCTDYAEEPAASGLVTKTAANTMAARTVTGTANQIDLTNGSGVAGNPTIALSSTLTIPGPGIEFTETAGDATCAAGNYWIKANSTTSNFRKCQNGTATDLDTGGAGGIGGATGATDNAVIRADGAGGVTIQNSLVTIDDTGKITAPGGIEVTGGTGYFAMTEGTSPGAGASAGVHNLFINSSDSKLHSHENGGVDVTYVRTADNLSVMAATTSAELAGVLSDEAGSAGGFVRATSPTLTTPTIATPTFSGTAPTLADGVTWTFNPNGTSSGLNVGSQAGALGTPNNGDVYYDSTANKFRCRENGSTVDCISTGAGSGDLTDVVAGAGVAVSTPGGPAPTVSWAASTFVNNVTLWDSANASRTLTAGLSGATDPVITFSNSTVNVSTGTLQEGGVAVSLPARSETLTNKTLDCAGTGNTCTIKQEHYSEVAGCVGATPGAVWNLPTTGAAAACDTGSNIFSAWMAFADAANESFHGSFRLPTGFTGNIDWMFRYKMSAGTTNAIGWCVQLVRLPTGSAADPALPALSTSNCVSDTIPGTVGHEKEVTISAATCASCAAGDRVFFRVSRDGGGTAVTDSATGVGRLVLSGPAYAVA
ncbi:MAG: hypothetical protein K2Y33_11790, partial [Mycolicibacterium frederiksbergense]|nr:hypothetical protein [Mycolicibacterium frederiksbergense]